MNLSVPVRELSVAVIRPESTRRRRALRRFDKELANRNYKAAHSQLKQLLNKPGGLIGFASAKLVPKNIPAMNTQQLCMVDSILSSIKYSINFDPLSDDQEWKMLRGVIPIIPLMKIIKCVWNMRLAIFWLVTWWESYQEAMKYLVWRTLHRTNLLREMFGFLASNLSKKKPEPKSHLRL